MKKLAIPLVALLLIPGCAGSRALKSERQNFESGTKAPAWAMETRVSWQGEGDRKFKGFQTVKGEERVNACYSLAQLNTQEQIASEIWTDFEALVSHSSEGISESTEEILAQSRSRETKGKIRGLRFVEAFHQRYLENGVERIDCFVLAEMNESDFQKLRTSMLSPVLKADPKIREAIQQQHQQFFQRASASLDSAEQQ